MVKKYVVPFFLLCAVLIFAGWKILWIGIDYAKQPPVQDVSAETSKNIKNESSTYTPVDVIDSNTETTEEETSVLTDISNCEDYTEDFNEGYTSYIDDISFSPMRDFRFGMSESETLSSAKMEVKNIIEDCHDSSDNLYDALLYGNVEVLGYDTILEVDISDSYGLFAITYIVEGDEYDRMYMLLYDIYGSANMRAESYSEWELSDLPYNFYLYTYYDSNFEETITICSFYENMS